MKFRSIVLVGILFVVAAAGVYGWFRYINHPKPVACGYCLRPLRANLMVTAEIAGKRTQVCCARCAITEANQERKPLRLIEVHDYSTGRAVPPQGAWFVEGSQVMACSHHAMHMDEMKDTQELAFDRCSPSTLAFASRENADAFVAQNGGAILSLSQLMSEARFQ
jgi:hypothetical protein